MLKTTQLTEYFNQNEIFTNKDVRDFYRLDGDEVSKSAINWRIHKLVEAGIISRVGRGQFKIGTAKKFVPTLNETSISVAHSIQKKFPLIDFCIWNTAIIRAFTLHQSFTNFLMVEVEKDALEAVFHFLKESHHQVYLKPKRETVEHYLLDMDRVIIVQHLVSEAPLQRQNKIPTITIEKLLVDVVHNKEVLYFYQGAELTNIFKRAFEKYNVNKNTLLRYASRRRKKQVVSNLLKTIKRQ